MRTIIDASGLEALTVAELEALSGGGPPGWWWMFTFFIAETSDLITGIRSGYNAAS